jgi:putative endonuclease
MLTIKQLLGNRGEDLARKYLLEQGCEIIECNYRFKRSEVDLIVKDGQFLVFVEVKTRKRVDYGHPEESVGERKAQKIIEAADEYIFQSKWDGPIRFDIVSVTIIEGKADVVRFKDAFY